MVDRIRRYYESDAISQSQLKLLLVNPTLFNTVREPESFYEEKRHFVIGSAVDCLLTQPHEFEKEYHVTSTESKPTSVVMNIIHRVYEGLKESYPTDFTSGHLNKSLRAWPQRIIEACDEEDYYATWNEGSRLAKIYTWQNYFEDLFNAEGKQVLSQEEKDIIDSVVMSLTSNDLTVNYVKKRDWDMRYVYQNVEYFEFEGVRCKALLDLVIVDDKNRTLQPVDIKTVGDYTQNFSKSVRKRRYDIQAAYYTEALRKRYPKWTVLPFIFVVESTLQPGSPLVYKCDDTLIDIGKNGRTDLFMEDNNGVTFKLKDSITGFKQLIDLYKYHQEHGFQTTKLLRESDGVLTMDWEGVL